MGFDYECILNIQSVAGEYFCPVCRTLVYPNEALQTQCTHLYCKPCLAYVASSTQACPYDGYLVTEAGSKLLIETNKYLAETIGKIAVRCLYYRSGCMWQGSLSECTFHSAQCAFGNYPVVCNICGFQILHRQVHEHVQICNVNIVNSEPYHVANLQSSYSRQPQAQISFSGQPQPHHYPQAVGAAPDQNQAQVNRQQQVHPAVQTHKQIDSQNQPLAHPQMQPQLYPQVQACTVQSNIQQQIQMPHYQQPHLQMYHSQPPQGNPGQSLLEHQSQGHQQFQSHPGHSLNPSQPHQQIQQAPPQKLFMQGQPLTVSSSSGQVADKFAHLPPHLRPLQHSYIPSSQGQTQGTAPVQQDTHPHNQADLPAHQQPVMHQVQQVMPQHVPQPQASAGQASGPLQGQLHHVGPSAQQLSQACTQGQPQSMHQPPLGYIHQQQDTALAHGTQPHSFQSHVERPGVLNQGGQSQQFPQSLISEGIAPQSRPPQFISSELSVYQSNPNMINQLHGLADQQLTVSAPPAGGPLVESKGDNSSERRTEQRDDKPPTLKKSERGAIRFGDNSNEVKPKTGKNGEHQPGNRPEGNYVQSETVSKDAVSELQQLQGVSGQPFGNELNTIRMNRTPPPGFGSSSAPVLHGDTFRTPTEGPPDCFPVRPTQYFDQGEYKEGPVEFPRLPHLSDNSSRPVGGFGMDRTLKSIDKYRNGYNYDDGKRGLPGTGGPSSGFLPPNHSVGALANNEVLGGPLPDFSRHHVGHFLPSSPGNPSLSVEHIIDDVNGRDRASGARFPILPPGHMYRGELDGTGNMRMGEQLRSVDLVRREMPPSQIHEVHYLGPRNFSGHPHVGELGFGSFQDYVHYGEPNGPGGFLHQQPSGESFGTNSIHPHLSEPGFCSSYFHQEFPDDGVFYAGGSKSFDKLKKRKSFSTWWCRICKVDCGSQEGLEIHGQTRKHQKIAMDMVKTIKQKAAREHKPSNNHFVHKNASKPRNVGS